MPVNSPTIQTIDLSQQVAEIRRKYGARYHFHPEYYADLRELWGMASTNDCGVITNPTIEVLVKIGSCEGEIRFAESQKGYWLIGVSAQTSISGSSYAPSVCSDTAYASYEDARTAGILRLMSFFESEAATLNSCSSHSNRHNAQEAAK